MLRMVPLPRFERLLKNYLKIVSFRNYAQSKRLMTGEFFSSVTVFTPIAY